MSKKQNIDARLTLGSLFDGIGGFPYMMLGNSVAVPCVAYILMGIAAAHRKEAL